MKVWDVWGVWGVWMCVSGCMSGYGCMLCGVCWLRVAGCWLLAVGCWLLAVGLLLPFQNRSDRIILQPTNYIPVSSSIIHSIHPITQSPHSSTQYTQYNPPNTPIHTYTPINHSHPSLLPTTYYLPPTFPSLLLIRESFNFTPKVQKAIELSLALSSILPLVYSIPPRP
jgi:hypothetical protein